MRRFRCIGGPHAGGRIAKRLVAPASDRRRDPSTETGCYGKKSDGVSVPARSIRRRKSALPPSMSSETRRRWHRRASPRSREGPFETPASNSGHMLACRPCPMWAPLMMGESWLRMYQSGRRWDRNPPIHAGSTQDMFRCVPCRRSWRRLVEGSRTLGISGSAADDADSVIASIPARPRRCRRHGLPGLEETYGEIAQVELREGVLGADLLKRMVERGCQLGIVGGRMRSPAGSAVS